MLSKDRMPAVHWLPPAPFPFCVNIRAEQRKKFSSLTILRRFKTVQNRAAPKKQKIVVETGSTDWKTSELLPLSKNRLKTVVLRRFYNFFGNNLFGVLHK